MAHHPADPAPIVAPIARDAFFVPEGTLYLDGNSLGPLTRLGEAHLLRALDEWRHLGVAAWTEGDPPWYTWAERLAAQEADLLLGAAASEVAVTGQTTANLHQLLATFLRPEGARTRVVVDALAFPTDRYAVSAAAKRTPGAELLVIPSRDGRTLADADVRAAIDERTALCVLPSVVYSSGQLLDVAGLTAHARAAGARIVWDLSHSIGIVPHELGAWGVELAVWCNYKFLSAGPGGIGGMFVARALCGAAPALAGWWGSAKDRQFAMPQAMDPAAGAGRYQVGTPSILAMAPLAGMLELCASVPVSRVREASLALTRRLIDRADRAIAPLGARVVTPRAARRRGGHVAIAHPEAGRIGVALRRRGVVVDVRPPDLVRMCPNPWYMSDREVDAAVDALAAVLRDREYLAVDDLPAVT